MLGFGAGKHHPPFWACIDKDGEQTLHADATDIACMGQQEMFVAAYSLGTLLNHQCSSISLHCVGHQPY
jgi:hypothetical protein